MPANQITGVLPGQVFVHRNTADQVLPTALNALTVLQNAVAVLAIHQSIVCSTYSGGNPVMSLQVQCGAATLLWQARRIARGNG